MKKYTIAVLLLLCSVALFIFVKSGREQTAQAADFLPADVLFYGEQLDFTKRYKEFVDSKLGRAFSNINYSGIGAELGWDEAAVGEIVQLTRKAHGFLKDPGFDQLLGKEFSLALFPARSFSADNPAQAIEERLLLIARPRHNAQVLQFLAPYIARDIEQSTRQYGIHTITRYEVDAENTLSTVTVKGRILAAFDERLVRKSLDIYDDKTNNLADNIVYSQLRNTFKGAQLFQYLSLPVLMNQGKMIAGDLPDEEQRQFLDLLEQCDAWGAVAYGAWKEKGLIKEKIEIFYDSEKLDNAVATLFSEKPGENATLGMVPADTLLYYWTNNFNVPLIWEMYSKAIVKQRPGTLDLLQQELQDSVGMKLEEILVMIAGECGIIVKDVDGGAIPIPKIMVILQLKNPQKFMEVFARLLLAAEIPMSTKQYQGQDISYWGIAPQGGLQPAFTLLGEYLLLSNSRDLVKQVVALQKSPENILLQNPDIQKLKTELTRKNNSAAYIHIALMADALKSIVAWAGGIAVLQGPEVAHKADIMIKELVLPLLDGVAMYKQLASRSEVKENSIVIESTTLVME